VLCDTEKSKILKTLLLNRLTKKFKPIAKAVEVIVRYLIEIWCPKNKATKRKYKFFFICFFLFHMTRLQGSP